MKTEKNIENIEGALVAVLVFLLPLLVLSSFPNVFVTGKLVLVVSVVALLLLLKSIKIFLRGSIRLTVGTFDFPVFLLAGAYLASGIMNTPNKMEAFFLPGTASIMVAGALIYFLINQLSSKAKEYVPAALYASGVFVSLAVLLASAGIFKMISALPAYVQDEMFTPLGGSLAGAMFLAVVVPFGVDYLLKEKDTVKKAFWGVSLALVLFGAVISVFNILPGKPASVNLPDYNTSWVVAIDSLKISPLLGVGPGNYLTSFNRFRPLSYNQTNLWRIRFTTARDFYLTVMTESGLIGMTAMILLVYAVIKVARADDKEKRLVGWSTKNRVRVASLLILIGLLAVFPSSIVFSILLFVLLAVNADTSKLDLGALSAGHNSHESQSIASKLPIVVVITPVLILLGLVGFYGRRAVVSEYYYMKALNAMVTNQGGLAYDLLQKTMSVNPYADRYHTSYAQVNLALANSIAMNEELSDQDREMIGQLIQQAIREGKASVSLNPERAGNWELLASIYQAVMPLAEGADAYAVQSYNQAIALDPINPDLRLTLGNIYYAAGDYDSAIRILDLAAAAKPDYANARYNLAFALREKGAYEEAVQQMSVVLSLVDRDSQDYEIAKKALEELEQKRDAAAAEAGGESLTPPQGAQEQVITPPIELPADAEPPATPTPVPSPSPTPTPLP